MSQAVRDTEKEMKEIATACQNQDLHVKLITPYYDSGRDKSRLTHDDDEESVSDAEYDYLKSFLPDMQQDITLSKSLFYT